jgi:GT2 family glycosyltransferase
MEHVQILIPTYNRPTALIATLTSLCFQTYKNFAVIISDQTEVLDIFENQSLRAIIRILNQHGNPVAMYKHLPRRGLAEQRNFLLEKSQSPYVLFLDDDLILESKVITHLMNTIEEQQCGFVGQAPIGLSYKNDIRPPEQAIEFWEGKIQPEVVRQNTLAWQRHKLHNAANMLHAAQTRTITTPKPYKIAWVGGCVLYDRKKLLEVGGFSFWKNLPTEHCGEDVLAQLHVMEKFGGCAILPSGVYHQELPTTVQDRTINAPEYLH